MVAKVVKPSNDGDIKELMNTDPVKPEENSQDLGNNELALHLGINYILRKMLRELTHKKCFFNFSLNFHFFTDNSNILNETEFYILMQHFFQNNITKCNAEDVVTADSIIAQLLQIPTFKSSVINNNLIITKVCIFIVNKHYFKIFVATLYNKNNSNF